jgi:GntR family transcriptional regulator, sialic acid-inducible nan operon repressor
VLDGRGQTRRASSTRRDPVARPKLAELVQNRLLAVIEAENLRPGDPLPSERELMQSYAVGRPSIREAMQNLKRMGLIEINHGERSRVAAPSFERMVADMSETMRHVLMNSPATLGLFRDDDCADRRAKARKKMSRTCAGFSESRNRRGSTRTPF